MAKNTLISLDARQLALAEIILKDVKNGFPRAVRNTIDTTLTEARKTFYYAIQKNYALEKTKSREKEAIYIQRTKQNSLFGILRYRSQTLPLINFKTSPNQPRERGEVRKIITTEVRRGRKTTWRHAFIARMRNSGHVGVFERVGKSRFPINQIMGNTSIPQMINSMLARDPELRTRVQMISDKKLNEQITKILVKAGK